MNFSASEFKAAALAEGLLAVGLSNGHWQVKGGAFLVNYYPHGKRGPTIYVQGTTAGRRGTPEEAIAAAKAKPRIAAHCFRKKRRGNYRRTRKRMLEKSGQCHWCGCELTLDASTLDHKIPLKRGGLDNANNWVLACQPCNDRRAADMPELKEKTQ